MIPKNSTPIKNEILIDIIGKGLLTGLEVRIACYVMRWSWGFNNGNRRQDWTKSLSKAQIARDLGIYRQHASPTINEMVRRNILKAKKVSLKADGYRLYYQFNEHWQTWKSVTKSGHNQKSVTKSRQKGVTKSGHIVSPKADTTPPANASQDKVSETVKETSKETSTKETKTSLFGKTKYRFSDEDMKLAELLHNLILDRDPSYKWSGNNLMQRWANDVRLIRKRDKRGLTEIKELIIWSQNNPFWQSNIESIGKLRTKFSILKDRKRSEEENHARQKTPKGQHKRNPKEGWEEKPEYEALYD